MNTSVTAAGAAGQPFFRVTDTSGRVIYDEQQLLPMLARLPPALLRDALLRARAAARLPCPSGWSRVDFMFGRGEACDVSVAARQAGAALLCVSGSLVVLCLAYQLHRKRRKAEARSSMYRAVSLMLGITACYVLWAITSLLLPPPEQPGPEPSPWRLGFFFAAIATSCEYALHASAAFLNNAIDTMHSLAPARAARWHARVALLGDAARPAFFAALFCACGIVTSGSAGSGGDAGYDDGNGGDALSHRGLMLASATMAAVALLSAGMMALGAIGTGRAARSLGKGTGAGPLRHKLLRQRRAAALLARGAGTLAALTAVLAFRAPARRVTGTIVALYYALMCAAAAAAMLPGVWSYRFCDLLDVIETFERQAAPGKTLYYWFDIFVMNQHSEKELGQEQLLENLRAAVRAPGRVLLAMDSWRDPAPLARVWCLLEIYTAMQEGAELVMCLGSAEQASFADNVVQNQVDVQRVLETLDAREAEATVEGDRDMIFDLIRDGAGFTDFNRTIRDALRRSFERVVIAHRRL
eukprot:g4358.t1